MTKTNENKLTSNSKLLRKALKLTVKDLQSFKDISHQRSTIIVTHDAMSRELSKKNQEQFDTYKKTNFKNNPDAKINMLSDILFRNFDIQESNLEILKCYTDEYLDRFKKLEKNLSKTLILIDKFIEEGN